MSTAHDPPVARLLWGLIVVAAVGAVLSRPVGYSVVDLLPPGGVLVVLGSYFAARTLRENEVAQATQMLAGDNEAVRIAGVHRLGTVAGLAPRYRPYAKTTLGAFVGEDRNGFGPRTFAEAILDELEGLDERRVAKLRAVGFVD